MLINRWDDELSSEDSNVVLLHLAQWHISQVSQPELCSDLQKLITSGDVRGICVYDVDVSAFNAADLYHVLQIVAFFKKRQDVELGTNPSEEAWKTFVEAEQRCRETNEIFRKYARGGFYFPSRVESVLFMAQSKIAHILGDLPGLEALKLRFGPGATTSVKKKDASARRKLSSEFSCSEEALGILPDILAEMPTWSNLEIDGPDGVTNSVQVVPGRISFVRKNAKTDRTIGIEPVLNSMVQLGIGAYMADRLRMIGIDIRDQTRNQKLACEGSITGALATLDLKSASGLIACGFVESMLPLEWWSFLRCLRTGTCTTPAGDPLKLEQFSSMGNGFTFPLQTLLFYALCKSCAEFENAEGAVSVYGDDLIVPVSCVPLLLEVLNSCGFWVNEKKSFWSGPFRESCGKDYLSGIDVRPLYISGPLSGADVFRMHNFYARKGHPGACDYLLNLLSEQVQIFGPDGFGDGHLLGTWYPDPLRREDGWCGVTFETYTRKSIQAFYRLGADYVYPAYSIYVREDVSIDFPKPLKWGRGHGTLRPSLGVSGYNRDGKLVDALPGFKGYKRIKIYTLSHGIHGSST